MTEIAPVLIGGEWLTSSEGAKFPVRDPRTGERLGEYPVSDWPEVDRILAASWAAYEALESASWEDVARFLERFADGLVDRGEAVCEKAAAETGLAFSPRLHDVELPRTTRQLRLAADESRARRWTQPTVSPETRIASMLRPIPGVVAVFGPSNFPLAFNAVSGGDAAAALATGHPVVAKAHPLHAGTSQMLAEIAHQAAYETPRIPAAMVQLFYHSEPEVGKKLVGDDRIAASAFTGSRSGGLALKAAADAVGKPMYLEMSSVNPVVVLAGAMEERPDQVAAALAGSATLAGGQFCTQPGLFITTDDATTSGFEGRLASEFAAAAQHPLLSPDVANGLEERIRAVKERGIQVIASAELVDGEGAHFPSTLLKASGAQFLEWAEELQEEMFGPVSLLVSCTDVAEVLACVERLEGNLTGTIYSASDHRDDEPYSAVARALGRRVGRLLNDKVPTGVEVVAGMNHGGPYPATGHPGFTAVGVPASMRRFGMLQSFDNVRDERLPEELRAANSLGLQRYVNSRWTDSVVVWGS